MRRQSVLQALDAAAVRRWAAACVRDLDAHREAIDRINVFPVPDGDTGTNLLHTMRSALDALVRAPAEAKAAVGLAVSALARGALAGARGNSGVIISQVLRGLAEVLQGASSATSSAMRAALRRADELATTAVTDPVPGTVLSVLHAAADAAQRCVSDGLADVTAAAAQAAARALAETPRQLAVLAKAGVVDAGGWGLVVLLEALSQVVSGRTHPQDLVVDNDPRVARVPDALRAAREAGSTEYEYEVMYLLDGAVEEAASALRAELAHLGDCVSVVGDGGALWMVHVHCNDVGTAIEAGIGVGRPHRITVVRFTDQAPLQPARFVRERVVVAAVSGADAIKLFQGEGAIVARIDPDRPPTAADLLATIIGTRAAHVVVLPNDVELTALAEQAAEAAVQAGQDVVVVPTASPVQGLAAIAVHDLARRPGDDVVTMAEAAAVTRRGELVVALREALTWVGRCQAGDLLGMVDGEVIMIESDVTSAACGLVDRMLASGGELVTALFGGGAPENLAEALETHLRRTHPEVELATYRGGQSGTVVQLGVE
jgi:DAK2 domain fusion protein YloV